MTQNVDWFVVADSDPHGDGSRERPFHDPWLAFRRAEPGDTIHVACGIYFGRFDRSSWVVDCPNLTVLGGYSEDFSARAPWKTPSVLSCYRGYEYARENNLITGRGDHSGLVLDGLFFDAADRNGYGDKPGDGISRIPAMDGAAVSFNGANVTIRNCVIANSANGGVELSGSGSRFENNLLLNMIGLAMLHLRSASQMIDRPIVVAGNTFCFMHDMGDPAGTGGDRSLGVRVNCPAVIENNAFVSCGNAAIATLLDPTRIAVERNLFFVTPHNLIESRSAGAAGEIKEKNLEELEDLGFKSCAGNVVQDPSVAGLPPVWLDAYSRHMLAHYAKPPRDAVNALRVSAGLPALAPADLEKPDQQGALAPRYAVSDALNLTTGATQGFHAVATPVALESRKPAPMPEYRRIEWSAMEAPDPGLANTPVELRVGLGTELNAPLLADAGPETHMSVRVYKPGTDDGSLFVLIGRHAYPARQYREATTYQRGMEVEATYWLRGTYRTDLTASRQKATLVVDAIERAPAFAPPLPARPAGRDWFVRAGSSGGDGSREKPFRDPFQALEKAEGGDTIHVAAGDYFGKLRSGKWLVSVRYLALLGGYDAEFTARDPWTNYTRFVLDEEQKAKGRPEGTILSSEENSDGLVVDGFVFDGSSWNTYADGSLSLDASPLAPLVNLGGLRSPVTVRNCVFVNASDSAVVLDCPLAVFENNVVVNTSGAALTVRANGAGPAVVRNNTILFACDPTPRAGTGESSSAGTSIQLNGRAEVTLESNIIGLADNYGVRSAVPQQNLELRGNVFAANLFNHLSDGNYLWADDSNWRRRVEGDSSCRVDANQLRVPTLPVDAAFSDVALVRLFALPSRIKREEWEAIASAIGSTARPPVPQPDAPPVPASAPAPALSGGGSSIDDILAKLSQTTDKLKALDGPKDPAAPRYCPIYDYKKASELATDGPATEPGAHRRKLEVSFGAAVPAKPTVEYTPINAAELDEKRASLDGKPIELNVSQLRDSSSNPSVFPAGTDKNDYTAYAVVATDAETRTRLTIVVRDDTDVSKRISRAVATDKLHVRGTAYTTSGTSGLSIVVDGFELVES